MQIFGKGMVDANVSQDLLIVTHKNGVVNIYSLAWILKKAKVMDAPLGKLVQIQDEAGGVPRVGVVGEEGFGIPYTVKITGMDKYIYCSCYFTLLSLILLLNFSTRLSKRAELF